VSRSYVPKELRKKIAQQALNRCGYCLTVESIAGYEMDVEHIIPEALGGLTVESNLWLCCSKCNLHKADRTESIDPETGETFPFFNPRNQIWSDHFEWSKESDLIIGKTGTGRVTIEALKLNRAILVTARRRWVKVGLHPPEY
jgi:5-methylcytosine-specific restriction endonuclease McrA